MEWAGAFTDQTRLTCSLPSLQDSHLWHPNNKLTRPSIPRLIIFYNQTLRWLAYKLDLPIKLKLISRWCATLISCALVPLKPARKLKASMKDYTRRWWTDAEFITNNLLITRTRLFKLVQIRSVFNRKMALTGFNRLIGSAREKKTLPMSPTTPMQSGILRNLTASVEKLPRGK